MFTDLLRFHYLSFNCEIFHFRNVMCFTLSNLFLKFFKGAESVSDNFCKVNLHGVKFQAQYFNQNFSFYFFFSN